MRGVDVPPSRKVGGLASLEMTPSLLANPSSLSPAPSPSRSVAPDAPPAPLATSGLESEVDQLLGAGAAGCTPEKRDYFLAYAHTLYSSDPSNEYLLPVLHTIETAHPAHLPTLLLMSCVYYSRGNLTSSLYYNDKLLQYDPQYVGHLLSSAGSLRAHAID